MNEFIPKESDKTWLVNLLALIKVGGTWGTTWAAYKKVDDNTLEVLSRNPNLMPSEVEENINRVKIVCESIGIKFID